MWVDGGLTKNLFLALTKDSMCSILLLVRKMKYLNGQAMCASGSVGGARPCQGRGRGFESRLALFFISNVNQHINRI